MIPTAINPDSLKRQAADFSARLSGGRTILITTHVAPDGDAIASLLAAAMIVQELQSRPVCALDGAMPSRFLFLPGADQVLNLEQHPQTLSARPLDAALVLDCGSLGRIGGMADKIPAGVPLVNVDHHPDNTSFGALNLVYPQASSTTEILFDLTTALKLPISQELATLLFAGLLSDTGGFRFSNTSQKTFRVAAELAGHGVNPYHLADAIYRTNSAAGLKMLGQALESLELGADGRIALMTAQGWNPQDECEDAVDFALTVKGVRAAALLRAGNGSCRVSLRANGDYDVARIARRFGGGGHQKAAGFTSELSLPEVRRQVFEALSQEVADRAVPAANEK